VSAQTRVILIQTHLVPSCDSHEQFGGGGMERETLGNRNQQAGRRWRASRLHPRSIWTSFSTPVWLAKVWLNQSPGVSRIRRRQLQSLLAGWSSGNARGPKCRTGKQRDRFRPIPHNHKSPASARQDL